MIDKGGISTLGNTGNGVNVGLNEIPILKSVKLNVHALGLVDWVSW